MATDTPETFSGSCMDLVGYRMVQKATSLAFSEAGIAPSDIDVAEIHDSFDTNELITYEALSFCQQGTAGQFVDSGNNDYGGSLVVNPSGG